ncbi:MAG: YkgJ family cysteine cluster protein [Desulfamplus sp.]|nr:YkgJ family cysteine cluster protein [Desulfamplus sp.]MBF0411974.1 YkgJ family cysteine cluster protein [Desulfamplus sp.]
MDTTKKSENSSEIIPEQMGYDTKFQFECHKGVKCFTKCCRGIDIMLTPYDILTMRKELALTSEEFLAIYTDIHLLEKADLPIVTLKKLDDEQKSCPFVKDVEGCQIYPFRPSACRYYPLGMGSLSYASELNKGKDTSSDDAFFFMVKESHCLGFNEKKEWAVATWREDQGVNIRDEVNAGWTDLIVRKKTIPMSIKLSEQSKQMFFLACYNIDKFREFIFESTFLKRFSVDKDQLEEMRNDDIKLLQFGFEWLKSIFFKEGEINVKPRDQV